MLGSPLRGASFHAAQRAGEMATEVKTIVPDGERRQVTVLFADLVDRFLTERKVADINAALAEKKGDVSDKTLSISLDTSSRASWEAAIVPHLDDIPMPLIGKGEQNSVK